MGKYRSLTPEEISRMEHDGCTAADWNAVTVAEGFRPGHVRGVSFCGRVSMGTFDSMMETEKGLMRHTGIYNATLCDAVIGDDCLIENTGSHICRYETGRRCYISGIGRMTGSDGAACGEGMTVPVMNEAGAGNVIIYNGLTSQTAALTVANARDDVFMRQMRAITGKELETRRNRRCRIGDRTRITGAREITNTIIGDGCEINGASKLCNCTIAGTERNTHGTGTHTGSTERSIADTGCKGTYIGHDVICESTVVAAGAEISGGAKLAGCFVGEACHIGKGFSAEHCVFFANSHMDNGEACAAFCGPFTVSHHKSTLLIGGMFSFYNAGSATNYSNHAYKLGPIHHGTLERGSKTASGAHILMPATIGAFSMCMGKIENHPDTSDMPFSYIIASGGRTYLVPGRNLATAGTYRDTSKWHKRDMRPPHARRSIVNFSWLSPYTVQKAINGKRELERLLAAHGDGAAEYAYGTCVIRNGALKRGIRLYDMAIKMFFGEAVKTNPHARRDGSRGTGAWTDLAGMLVPQEEAERLAADIRSGAVRSIAGIEERMTEMNDSYGEWAWNMACAAIKEYYGIGEITDDDMRRISREGEEAWSEWRNKIADDARKEALLGDVDEEVVEEFLSKLGK